MGLDWVPALARRHAALIRLISGAATAFAAWSVRADGRLQLWRERRRQRRALGAVSDHMLKDMGLSRGEAGRESEKRFWQP
jgi:uncharacterized protein YjiS (DUF1127 family)